MNFRKMSINLDDAVTRMETWKNSYPEVPVLTDPEELKLRQRIQELYTEAKNEADSLTDTARKDYLLDTKMALRLYQYLTSLDGFSMRIAADIGFWRYLSLIIAPDVIAYRWGKEREEYYYSCPRRIWFRSMFWYVYLSWQGSDAATESVLTCNHFTSDTKLNFVERSGKRGTCVDAYRAIIKKYSEVPFSYISKNRRGKNGSVDLFRAAMKLNTARMMILEPGLCEGGYEAYARALFEENGVVFNTPETN